MRELDRLNYLQNHIHICIYSNLNSSPSLSHTLSRSLLSAVGAGEVHFGEVSDDIYQESLVYVDCMENARHELVGLPAPIAGEVGDVIINGNYPDEQALTIFQSMGNYGFSDL